MMPRVTSSLCAAGPASVDRVKPASCAIRVRVRSCGSSPAIASSTSRSRCGKRSRIRCTCASASPAAPCQPRATSRAVMTSPSPAYQARSPASWNRKGSPQALSTIARCAAGSMNTRPGPSPDVSFPAISQPSETNGCSAVSIDASSMAPSVTVWNRRAKVAPVRAPAISVNSGNPVRNTAIGSARSKRTAPGASTCCSYVNASPNAMSTWESAWRSSRCCTSWRIERRAHLISLSMPSDRRPAWAGRRRRWPVKRLGRATLLIRTPIHALRKTRLASPVIPVAACAIPQLASFP